MVHAYHQNKSPISEQKDEDDDDDDDDLFVLTKIDHTFFLVYSIGEEVRTELVYAFINGILLRVL